MTVWKNFYPILMEKNFYLVETPSKQKYTDINFKDGDFLIFGREKEGIDSNLLERYQDKIITIPMTKKLNRSLNLANSVSIVVYEALRQVDFNF